MVDSQRIRVEIRVSRRLWRGQRFWVRGVWVANGLVAFHSELYRRRGDAENLVEALTTQRCDRDGSS